MYMYVYDTRVSNKNRAKKTELWSEIRRRITTHKDQRETKSSEMYFAMQNKCVIKFSFSVVLLLFVVVVVVVVIAAVVFAAVVCSVSTKGKLVCVWILCRYWTLFTDNSNVRIIQLQWENWDEQTMVLLRFLCWCDQILRRSIESDVPWIWCASASAHSNNTLWSQFLCYFLYCLRVPKLVFSLCFCGWFEHLKL